MDHVHAPLHGGDHTVDLGGGLTIAYHVRGDGPICVAYPGGPGLEWTYLRMPEVEKHVRVVYYEPPGTGGSTALHDPAKYSFESYAEIFERFRDKLGLQKPCVIGHSYGGFVTLWWALAHPAQVGGLVLYDTAPRSGRGVDEDITKAAIDGYRNEPWFAATEAGWQSEPAANTDAEVTAVMQAEAPLMFVDWTHRGDELAKVVGPIRAFVEPYRGTGEYRKWDLRDRLGEIKAPTLVVVGAKDFITPPGRSQELVAGIAGAQLVTLPNSSHMGAVEEPEAFAAAVSAFVAKLP